MVVVCMSDGENRKGALRVGGQDKGSLLIRALAAELATIDPCCDGGAN